MLIYYNSNMDTSKELMKQSTLMMSRTEQDKIRATETLRDTIEEIGFSGIAQLNESGKRASWVIAQNSTQDISFMKSFLVGMTGENYDKEYLAYLEDYILILEGNPQKYGTRIDKAESGGGWAPVGVSDYDEINRNRKAIGLDTLENYLKYLASI